METNHEENPEDNEALSELSRKVADSFEKIGLYMQHSVIQATMPGEDSAGSLKDRLKTGDGLALLNAGFRIGDLAFTDRILNPEAHASEREFRMAMPSEVEMDVQSALEQLKSGKIPDED